MDLERDAEEDKFATTKQTSVSATPMALKLRSSNLPMTFGRYELVELLGEGSMGAVYLARDTQLERQVALKIPKLDGDHDAIRRFQREARAMATPRHANLCPIYDVGDIEGIQYFTMAYIEGQTLASHLVNGKPFPGPDVALLMMKLAQALDEAHQRGVVHRDLKPANIIIDHHKEPIVTDFGLAHVSNAQAQLTHAGFMIGTPAYMSPEQVKGDLEAIGPASDVYSLGAIMYQMLTGRLAFEGSLTSVVKHTITSVPACPSTIEQRVDPQLGAICLRAMAKEPRERFANGGELAAALRDYLKASIRAPAQQPPAVEDPQLERLFYRQAEQARELWQRGDYSAALPMFELLAEAREPSAAKYAQWAQQELPKVRERIAMEKSQQEFVALPAVASPYRAPAIKSGQRKTNQQWQPWLPWMMAVSALMVICLIVLVLSNNRGGSQPAEVAANQEATPGAVANDNEETADPLDVRFETESPATTASESSVEQPRTALNPTGSNHPPFPGEAGPAGPRHPPPRTAAQIIQDLDRNRDGSLSAAEIPPHQRLHLMRADTDKDGVVTQEEIELFHTSFPPPTRVPSPNQPSP
jgi:serine/threonine protein kinase